MLEGCKLHNWVQILKDRKSRRVPRRRRRSLLDCSADEEEEEEEEDDGITFLHYRESLSVSGD